MVEDDWDEEANGLLLAPEEVDERILHTECYSVNVHFYHHPSGNPARGLAQRQGPRDAHRLLRPALQRQVHILCLNCHS